MINLFLLFFLGSRIQGLHVGFFALENKMGKRKSYFHKKGESQAEKKLKLKFGESFNKIDTNMKGFLVTYNCKFTFCLNESKKLLQQFSLPSEVLKDKPTETSGDLDKELQQELDR